MIHYLYNFYNSHMTAFKILAITILRDHRSIQGFKIEQEILQIPTFADDGRKRWRTTATSPFFYAVSDFEYRRESCLSSIAQLFRRQQSLVALSIWLPEEFLRRNSCHHFLWKKSAEIWTTVSSKGQLLMT